MDRRVLLRGLFGAAGAGVLAVALPPQAEVLAGMPPAVPPPKSDVLPNLEALQNGAEEGDDDTLQEGIELASHRRRRRRRRRWRRRCRRHGWRRRCRRYPIWIWIG